MYEAASELVAERVQVGEELSQIGAASGVGVGYVVFLWPGYRLLVLVFRSRIPDWTQVVSPDVALPAPCRTTDSGDSVWAEWVACTGINQQRGFSWGDTYTVLRSDGREENKKRHNDESKGDARKQGTMVRTRIAAVGSERCWVNKYLGVGGREQFWKWPS